MTFGIDISTYQETLDVSDAVAAGTQFAGAKAVASYLPQLTVADGYHSNIDDIIEAGLDHAKFHYAVPNYLNTPEVTAQFQFDIRYRAKPTDAYLLDNEPLDKYANYWMDGDCALYFEKLHSLGIRYDQMWLYCPASLTRGSSPWPKMLALREKGVKIMWVSYGDLDAILEPGEEPNVGDTGFTDPDLHQFTSAWTVPGWTGKIDRIYSRLSVAQLFQGGPVSLEDQMRQYIAANPKPADAATWDQMCGSLMFRFNSWRGWATAPVRDISSAFRVSQGSTIISTDLSRAPVGAWHFFDIGGEANGHVMQDARGGGLVCLSTGYALSESLGQAIGFQSVPGYIAAKGARYIGWSKDYAGGTIDVSGTAGGGTTPIDNTRRKKMYLEWDTGGTGWLVTEDGWHGLGSMQVYNLFRRVINSNQSTDRPDTFNRTEVNIMNAQLRLLRTANSVNATIDPVKLASAIADALNANGQLDVNVTIDNLQDAKFEVDPVILAAAFDAAVPRVAKAILKEQGTALSGIE